MSGDVTLWGDQYAPVTSAIGFLRAPLDVVSDGLLAWRRRIHGTAEAVGLSGGLHEHVSILEPLTGGVRPRELVVATGNPEWTATFDCLLTGSDPISTVGYLSLALHVQGIVVRSVPDARATAGRPPRYGARQFEMFAPISTDFINYVRTISVIRDGSRWRFDANGTVQDFEDPEAYQQRRAADRFTGPMLVEYSAALGLRPFDDDFYPGPCVLVTNPSVPPPDGLILSIESVQKRLGIVPWAQDSNVANENV
jgi:hypothetical protein